MLSQISCTIENENKDLLCVVGRFNIHLSIGFYVVCCFEIHFTARHQQPQTRSAAMVIIFTSKKHDVFLLLFSCY